MKAETKYQYQKRIKELEDRVRIAEGKLYDYRTAAINIRTGCLDSVEKNFVNIKISWVLRQFNGVWK